ncbi:unnamed protein product [Clonostachys rosea f. rosea IK726]|uniref:Uncharacterized protein n=1 Tax=Clonostachys rosea f. rosea IK726 TaxID=1349383 RepID=A0ACA9UCP2_BIOOC|nr:unnamed protein product [Clonostachys rosea f. rosea IK726]
MAKKNLVASVRLTNTDKNKPKDKIEDGLRIATLKSKSRSSIELLSIWKMNLQRRREYPTQRIGMLNSSIELLDLLFKVAILSPSSILSFGLFLSVLVSLTLATKFFLAMLIHI